jgi:hypothetical protein
MILSALRTQLRGWLQDTSSIQWTDAQLNRYINLALRETEKHILAVDPEAFKCTYRAATTVASDGADNIYSYPVGTFAVHEIALSGDGVSYAPIQRLTLKNARDGRSGNIGYVQGFIPYDAKHFVLWPGASTAVTNGIRIIVAPTLVIADDTNASPIPHAFETLNLKHAQLFALWDVEEPTEKVQAEVDKLKSETPRFYLTATEPPFVTPMINRGF